MKTSELFCKFKERLHMQLVSRIIDTKIELSEEADILFSCMSFGYFCISLSLIKTGATIWIQRNGVCLHGAWASSKCQKHFPRSTQFEIEVG